MSLLPLGVFAGVGGGMLLVALKMRVPALICIIGCGVLPSLLGEAALRVPRSRQWLLTEHGD